MSSKELARKIAQSIDQWRQDLIELGRRNPLLNFKPRATSSVNLKDQAIEEILTRTKSSKPTYIVGTKKEESLASIDEEDLEAQALEIEEKFDYSKHPEAIFVDRTQRDVDRVVRNMASRSTRLFLDKGVDTLHVAIGALSWFDTDTEAQIAPLLLIPSRLSKTGPRQPYSLSVGQEELTVNPALLIKLQEFGVELPAEEEIARAFFDYGAPAALDLIRQTELPGGWRFIDLQVLSMFTFHKEAMYRDLLENEAAISSSPLIQALGSGEMLAPENFFFDPLDDSDLDEMAPPELSQLVLDADSSQRAAIDAALNGKSFVLDGPPGTGKSQTIANMIGALIGSGKSVLFVSEKIVALEVVKERLDSRGLASLVFELHSAKTTRKEVAQFLGRSLNTRPTVKTALKEIEINKARLRRVGLNSYAQAMNEIRPTVELSIFEALGLIEKNGGYTATPEGDVDLESLSAVKFEQLVEASQKLQKHWTLYESGADGVWYGLQNDSEIEFKLEKLTNALEQYDKEYGALHKAAQVLRLQGTFDFPNLLALLEIWASGPEDFQNGSWLVDLELDQIAEAVSELSDISQNVQKARAGFRSLIGCSLDYIPKDSVDSISAAAVSFSQAIDDSSGIPLDEVEKIAAQAQSLGSLIDDLNNRMQKFAIDIGIEAPDKLDRLRGFVSAIEMLESLNFPPPKWIANRVALAAGESGVEVLRPIVKELREKRDGCKDFMHAALELDLESLQIFFETNTRFWNKFSRDYRKRRRSLVQCSASGKFRNLLEQLDTATKWQSLVARLSEAEEKHAEALEGLYRGIDTDWDHLEQQVQRAKEIAKAIFVTELSAFVAAMETNRSISGVRDLVEAANTVLGELETFNQLLDSEITASRYRLSLKEFGRVCVDLGTAAGSISNAHTGLKKGGPKLLTIRPFLEAMKHFERFRNEQETTGNRIAEIGSLLKTNIEATSFFAEGSEITAELERRLTWTSNVVEMVAGFRDNDHLNSLTRKELLALKETDIGEDLHLAASRWQEAFDSFCESFAAERRPELAEMLHEFEDGSKYLKLLKSKLPEIDAWVELDKSLHLLKDEGCQPIVRATQEMKIPSQSVSGFIICSVLRAWVGHHIRRDTRFDATALVDRNELIREFREIDQKLKDHAISKILEATDSYRPKTFHGQASGIQREAEKKTRHKSVRDQISQSDEVIKSLHPCFMMSPLAVSQFLPSDVRFDVVIFDEASQVTPADAVNCIYRGKALIAAGDQKQLPPTNFFRSIAGEDENVDENVAADYESILDLMKASAAFNSLTLRWHYRSKHEHLIAFSNASFYEGKLITFPGSVDESPDLGVKFFKVRDGIYRRSAGSDNPKEALAVAERVIHHFDTRPEKSLGVVAFSTNQQSTIEHAVDLARQKRPDLDWIFERDTGDRQRGFFVQNLESVQGDERDVIIFSIGYGPDENGKIYKAFGPISRKGGERRLNVAFTRARELIEVVSSIDAADLGSLKAGPAQHLRRYLDYAERGPAALQLELGSQNLPPESPFEESVISQIRSWGYDVQPQVGVAGYRIDIGVIHPEQPGAFLMGIECDGAMYHSSLVARDRDRLRHEVLEGLGWNLYHIWGTAWYRHRDAEIQKLRARVDELAKLPLSGRVVNTSGSSIETIEVDFEQIKQDGAGEWVVDYTVAQVDPIPSHLDLAEVSNARRLVPLIERVVRIEEPVHIETLTQRLRQAADIGRVGQRIRKTLNFAIRLSEVVIEDDFLSVDGSSEISVRRPHPDFPREVDRIHPLELKAAIKGVCADAIAITNKDLVEAVSEVFGWKRKGEKIVTAITGHISSLLKAGLLIELNGSLRITAD